jgi:uncharacterized membrane protein (UPF0127 family)
MAESDAELRVVHNLTRDTELANRLETASGLWAKFAGLMGRSTLRRNHALWLPDSNGIHMMFMRFPIDAVFLDRADGDATRRVVSVHRELRPWTGLVPFVRHGHGVLELPAGVIEATATAVGDVIAFEDWPEAS